MMTQDQHEETSAEFLVSFVNNRREDILCGRLDGEDPHPELITHIWNMAWCFFDNALTEMNIKRPPNGAAFCDVLDYADMVILEKMAKMRPDLLSKDWQGRWEIAGTFDNDEPEWSSTEWSPDDDEHFAV